MKIAFLTEAYDPFINGVVTSIKTLRKALERQGHEVVIFAPAYPGHEDHDPKVVRLPSVRWLRGHYPSLSPLARNLDVLAEQGFDIVHSHHPFTMGQLGVRLARKHGLPLIYTYHTMLNEYGQYVPLLESAVGQWLVRRYLRHCAQAHRVTSATEVVRRLLQSQGVRTPIEVVPEGVVMMQPAEGARARLRQQLGVSERRPLLLYAGRLAREKRLDMLLRSVALLGRGRAVRLCLAGGGPWERELRGAASGLGIAEQVTFAGWVEHAQLAHYYAAADVFVFPSPADAMGIVLVEAMSAGLPCVAVDKYGPSEVVRDGVTGFLTAFDEREFSVAVRWLLDDPLLRHRMAAAARIRARDFDPDVTAARMVQVYEEAIGGGERVRHMPAWRTV
jgi:glycosyltransferase involved in cell wall biosynthesis